MPFLEDLNLSLKIKDLTPDQAITLVDARLRGSSVLSPSMSESTTSPAASCWFVPTKSCSEEIPRASVNTLAQRAMIPAPKVSRQWRLRKAAIDRWLGDGILVLGQAAQSSDEDVHGK